MFITSEKVNLHAFISDLRVINYESNSRLTPSGILAGCVSQERQEKFLKSQEIFEKSMQILKATEFKPGEWREILKTDKNYHLHQKSKISAWDLMKVKKFNFSLQDAGNVLENEEILQKALKSRDLCQKLQTECLYEKFIIEQKAEMEEIKKDEMLEIPADLDFMQLNSLSFEEREKLEIAKPCTIAAASRLPGITPNGILTLLRFVRKKSYVENLPQFT